MPTFADYDEFLEGMRQEVERCPEPTLQDMTQRVIVEFFERSEAWQIPLDPLWPIENENEYALSGAVSGVAGSFGGLPWQGNQQYVLEDKIQGSVGGLAYKLECILAGTSDATQDVSDAWVASTVYSVGDEIGVTSGGNEYLFECVAAGTSDTAAPTWPSQELQGVIDGTVGWQNMGLNYTEPTWPATESESVVDSGVLWQNMGRITTIPAGVVIISFREMTRNGRPMDPGNDFMYDVRSQILKFRRDPVVTDEYHAKIAVKPKRDKTLIPDALVEQYITVIKAGVLFRLMTQPDKFWTNMARGGAYRLEWIRGIGSIRNRMLTGHTGAQPKAKARTFGFL